MQIITRGGKVMCRASIHYSEDIVKQMKKAGYKVKEVDDENPKKGK